MDPKHEKIVKVAKDDDSEFIEPSPDTASDGSYPLARNLFMYTAGEPVGAVAEYLDWILGPDGQEIVGKLGFVPLSGNE